MGKLKTQTLHPLPSLLPLIIKVNYRICQATPLKSEVFSLGKE
jgi:hypothetical protein